MVFVGRVEKMVGETILHRLSGRMQVNNRELEYAYAFCLNGCVGLIKTWLSSQHQESTEYMARLTCQMIEETTHNFLRQITGHS